MLTRLSDSEPKLPLQIALLADPQGTPHDLRRVVERINNLAEVDFIFVLGDLTDFGLKDEYIDYYKAIGKAKAPIISVLGNHDAISFGKRIYIQMFGGFDFTFDIGELRFIVWNNNKWEFGNNNNLDWLENALAAADREGKRVIVASHIHPKVDIHTEQEVKRWLDLYESSRVLVSVHGHRGTSSPFLETRRGVPIYVVAKTKGQHFSLLKIAKDLSIRLFRCKRVCEQDL